MKRYVHIAAAAFIALVSCSKEQETANTAEYFEQGETVVLAVKADDTATRVGSELDSKNIVFKWQSGDKILVTVGGSTAQFTLTGGAGTTSAIFEGKMPAAGSTFNVQYPCQTPELANQTYSGTEPLPHDKMLFTATNCSTTDAVVSLQCQYAALRLNLYGTSQTIGKIVVTNTTSGTSSYTLDCGDGVTIGSTEAAATSFFIVVNPEGTDWDFSAKIFDNASTPASICSFKTTTAKTFTKGWVLNMPKKVVEKNYALSGDFTVNASGGKVNFSCGNLYHDGSAFKFETTQYAKTSTWDQNHVCRFFWAKKTAVLATDITYALSISSAMQYTCSTKDIFFTNDTETTPRSDFSVEGQTGKWRTLSKSEWDYLLNTRTVNGGTGEKYSYRRASINSDATSVYGLIIYPDNYGKTSQSSYTSAEWTAEELSGCVFLPAAGLRNNNNKTNLLESNGSIGHYNTSSPYTGSGNTYYSWKLVFSANVVALYDTQESSRYYGRSTRLVVDVK